MKLPQLEPLILEESKEPAKDLIAAMIYRALLDLLSSDLRVKREAFNWCMSNRRKKKGVEGFTFLECCEYLDLDLSELRTRIKYIHSLNKSKVRKENLCREFLERLWRNSRKGRPVS